VGGSKLKLLLAARGVAPAPDIPVVSVGASYNGDPGSGWPGGVGEPVPTTRGAAPQPWINPLFVPFMTYDGNVIVGFQAGAGPGVEKVIVSFEGGSVEITSKSWASYPDANGVMRQTYGYHATLNHSAAMAASSTGRARLYAEAVPNNRPTFESRIVGPFLAYPRASLWDVTKTVATSGADYTNLKDALTFARLNQSQRVKIVITETGRKWRIDRQAALALTPSYWTTITTAPGVQATIGDGGTTLSSNGVTVLDWTQPGIDQLHFMGAGIKWDLSEMAQNFSGNYYNEKDSGARVWLDGIELTTGTPNWPGGSGSGWDALKYGNQSGFYIYTPTGTTRNYYFTEVNAHDLSGFGLSQAQLVRNSELHRVSGSALENNVGAIHNVNVSQVGGYQPGLRTNNPGATLTYLGAAAYAAIEKIPTNGNASLPLTITNPGSGYVDGVYLNRALAGGSGTGGLATITVAGGVIVSAVSGQQSAWGVNYKVGDVLTLNLALPGGGSGAVFTVGGNVKVYEGTSAGTAVVTHEFLAGKTTPVSAFVTAVNTLWGPNWSAVDTTDKQLNMSFLSLASLDPAMNIPKTQISGSIDLTLKMDIHANIVVTAFGNLNGSVWGVTATNYVGAASLSGSSNWIDYGVESSSWQDASAQFVPPVGAQSGYFTAAFDHVVMRYLTMQDASVFFNSDPRINSLLERSALNDIGATSSPGMSIIGIVVLTGALPVVADAKSKTYNGTGATNDTFYVDYVANDISPQQSGGVYPLQLSDGTFAGRYLPGGAQQLVP